MAITERSVEEHWAVCLQEFIAHWGMMKDTDARSPGDSEMHDSVTKPTRSSHPDSNGDEAHGAGHLHEMLRPHSGNLSYIPNQSRGLNLPEYDGGVGAQNEARIMKPEGSNGTLDALERGEARQPGTSHEETVGYDERHPEQIDHR
ncbi:hypothetical protein LTR91_027096, partial [Friedmanniomyces endolithicus]